jgi:DNA topoisomerase-2
MIMTDQDQDGSHIKGLLINFIHHFWPELLTFNTFLVEFITPIVKVRSGKQEKTFFTIPQYQEWAKERGDDLKRWTIKYYKGLGTSTPKEAKEYFSDMAQHMKSFEHVDEEDDKAIELCFSKTKVEDRKEWLRGFKPGTFLDHSVDKIRYADFINKEMILFSMMDNERSIPSLVDGFKPGQRKVLFAVFKRNLKQELKVAQLAGYVAEHSSYHHGEVSLGGTIVGMAQNYVGSNNISLLEPIGQFGTRLQGGKDAASTRYIFTKMSPLARVCFSPHDDQLLSYLNDDGQSIEPKWYIPVLPMVLVNGSDGIGTGWSSSIPTYNPADIIANIRSKLSDRSYEFQSMTPWYKGFTGQVVPKETKGNKLSFAIIGTIQKVRKKEEKEKINIAINK